MLRSHTQRSTAGRACPRQWRLAAAVLAAASGCSFPLILVLVLVSSDPPITLPILFRLVFILTVLPGLAAWLIGRAFAVDIDILSGSLVLHGRDERTEVPCASIDRIVPWIVPLPGPGFSVVLRSGRRLARGIETAGMDAVLSMLADAGVAAAGGAAEHPAVVFARHRLGGRRGLWWHPLIKFVLFGLLPAIVFFQVHQRIAYGGPLGEYRLLGAASYLRTFGVYWLTMAIYLGLYAGIWRGLAEGVCLAAAWVVPKRAGTARRAADAGCLLVYYAGVPALIAWRFLQ